MTFHDAAGHELTFGPSDEPAAESPPTTPGAQPSSVVLSAEQLSTGTEWTQSGRLRLRRRIVSETRTIEVVVRREELVIETDDVTETETDGTYAGTALDGPPASGPNPPGAEPFVAMLREEVPVVTMQLRDYERVRAHVLLVEDTTVLHHTVRSEQADM